MKDIFPDEFIRVAGSPRRHASSANKSLAIILGGSRNLAGGILYPQNACGDDFGPAQDGVEWVIVEFPCKIYLVLWYRLAESSHETQQAQQASYRHSVSPTLDLVANILG